MADYIIQDSTLTAIADAVRGKTGDVNVMTPLEMVSAIEGISTGGGGSSGGGGDVNADVRYFDYDGTLLHSYSAAEALALTEEPPLPERSGLICQGWNVSLAEMQTYVGKYGMRDIGATYITDDGKTRLYIHLEEGRTSPMLGINVEGTVTVDWGDGSAPDVLTGTDTSTTVWTPNHEYGKGGDYVITLTVDGNATLSGSTGAGYYANILHYTSGKDSRNLIYQNALQKAELGANILLGSSAFNHCQYMKSVNIPNGIEILEAGAFTTCYRLLGIVIPRGTATLMNFVEYSNNLSNVCIPDSVNVMENVGFRACGSLERICVPEGIVKIGALARECKALKDVVLPDSVEQNSSGYIFTDCQSLRNVRIPNGFKVASNYMYSGCSSLVSATIHDGTTSLGNNFFYSCGCLTTIRVPASVTNIPKNAFCSCEGMKWFDFASHTTIPTLAATTSIYGIPDDCEIRVPAALAEEWKAATNWSTHASKIVGV